MSLTNPKNSVTVGIKSDAKAWNLLKSHFGKEWDAKEIGYIGTPSRKTFIFKDRAKMEQYVELLRAKRIVLSVDCIYPTPDLW